MLLYNLLDSFVVSLTAEHSSIAVVQSIWSISILIEKK